MFSKDAAYYHGGSVAFDFPVVNGGRPAFASRGRLGRKETGCPTFRGFRKVGVAAA